MAPTILLTRAEDDATDFAESIRSRFGAAPEIVLSPLMRIDHVRCQPENLDGFASVIFTSRNGVRAFAARTSRRDWPCYCVGDATAATAKREGLRAVSANGTVDDLAELLRSDPPPTPCLYVRGDHVASDLAKLLNSAGIDTIEAVLYRQVAQDLTADARAVLGREKPVILPLFSPRSSQLFFEQNIGVAPLFVAAISEKTAKAVSPGRVHTLRVASTPTAPAMLDAMQGLFDTAKRLEGGGTAQ